MNRFIYEHIPEIGTLKLSGAFEREFRRAPNEMPRGDLQIAGVDDANARAMSVYLFIPIFQLPSSICYPLSLVRAIPKNYNHRRGIAGWLPGIGDPKASAGRSRRGFRPKKVQHRGM